MKSPWIVSGAIHAFLGALALYVYFSPLHHKENDLDIAVIDAPVKAEAVPVIHPVQPKAMPKKSQVHEVFGAIRNSLTAEDGVETKQGNTVAKAPDLEKLKPEDPDHLPIPTEEYLVTQMPVLTSDLRVPYPPEAKKKGIQGKVVMDLLIDSNGHVREVKVIEAPIADLGDAAAGAARGFQFKPALVQEKPVAVRIHYSYRFVLEH